MFKSASLDLSVIRKVTAASGIISTVAGNGNAGFSGDGGPAVSAALSFPIGVTFDGAGNLFIADGVNSRIRRVTISTGNITTVAGNGQIIFSGDNVAATTTALAFPASLAFDANGNLVFADVFTPVRIRAIKTPLP